MDIFITVGYFSEILCYNKALLCYYSHSSVNTQLPIHDSQTMKHYAGRQCSWSFCYVYGKNRPCLCGIDIAGRIKKKIKRLNIER